jgi:hypothetical protein
MAKEKLVSTNDGVAIARAAYEAYVSKDRDAIEKLIATTFTSPVHSTIGSTAQRISNIAGQTARGSKVLTLSILFPTAIECSLRTKVTGSIATGSAIPR